MPARRVFQDLLNALRSTHRAQNAATQLATHAAVWKASRDSTPPPWTKELHFDLPGAVEATHLQWLEEASADDLVGHVSDLVYAASADSWGAHLTSQSLDAVAEIALLTTRRAVNVDAIYDPTAGVGGTLLRLWSATQDAEGGRTLLAQEINDNVAALAQINFYLSGATAEVAIGDSLIADAFASQKIGLAVSQPPWGASWKSIQSFVAEQAAFDGPLPSATDSQWLFALRIIDKFHPPSDGGGRGVVFLTGAALAARNSQAVRARLLEDDVVDSVIALPSGVTPDTAVPLFAVVLDTAKSAQRKELVQFVDLRAQFETSKSAGTPRALGSGAVELLRSALDSDRDGPISRTVGRDHFFRTRYTVRRIATEQSPEWPVDIPGDRDVDEFVTTRYAGIPVLATKTTDLVCVIDPDSVYPSKLQGIAASLRKSDWEATRLSALLVQIPELLDEGRYIPVSADLYVHNDFVHDGASEDPGDPKNLHVVVDPAIADADFLNSWLRSELGRESMRVARSQFGGAWRPSLVRNSTSALTALADNLVIPIGPLEKQTAVAQVAAELARARQTVVDATGELWASPNSASSIRAKFAHLGDESLSGWSETLPFPVAGALWTLETKGTQDAKRKQALLTVEAYTTYLAALLLSGAHQDDSVWDEQVRDLKAVLSNAHLSMERPTFGTWVVICQRLASGFRKRIAKDDPEELAQLSGLFGGASIGALTRVLDPLAVSLLEEANRRRNSWDAHAGTLSQADVNNQLGQLLELLTELRGIVGAAWQELPLVRAGKALRRGSTYVCDVELLSGSRTPFVKSEYAFGEMPESGGLFVGQDGTASPLRLLPIFTLQSGPNDEVSTGYFFNRLERDGSARLVTYQASEFSEMTVPKESVEALAQLW